MSVLVSTLSKSQGDLSGPHQDDHFSAAAKMQLYFVNCLVGFFVVVATFPTTSARVPFFFATFPEEADTADSEALDNPLLNEPANELSLGETMPDQKTNKKENKLLEKYVKAELIEPLSGIGIKEGQSFTLSCTVTANSEATVYWLRGDDPEDQIRELMSKSVTEDSQMMDQDRMAIYNLKYLIDCASKKDAGPIHCVGISGERYDYQSTSITVESNNKRTLQSCDMEHEPVITSSISTILSNIGSTIVIPCEAKGFPQPKTKWVTGEDQARIEITDNDRFTVLETGELIIKRLAWGDMGSYECIAHSPRHGIDSAKTFVYPMALHKT